MWSINQEIPEFSYFDMVVDQFLNIKIIKESENKKNDEKNSYLYLYHPDKDVVEWIDKNHRFNLVEKDVQVIEKNEGYIKKKIRSCIYHNNITSTINSIWHY